MMLCNAAGLSLDDSRLPGVVTKVRLGSPASHQAIVEGDRILRASLQGKMLTLDIERKGVRYQTKFEIRLEIARAQMNEDVASRSQDEKVWPAPKDEAQGEKADQKPDQKFTLKPDIPNEDKFFKAMSPYQVVLLIDHSGSMNGGLGVGPYDLSRWGWCRSQITDFSRYCGDRLRGGITLIPFNDSFEVHEHASEKDLEDVFSTIVPSGETDICTPLAEAISSHLDDPDHENKPVLIVVLTDGLPNQGGSLSKLISQATNALRNHKEMTITFLTIGQAPEGDELIEHLDNDLTNRGAKADIVSSMRFADLLQIGLKNALLKIVLRANNR
jgi:Mg-chelatase subunit ChlD